MSQIVVIVTLYLCRRKRCPSARYGGRYTYEVWVVAEVRPARPADAVTPQLLVDPRLSTESARKLGDDLRDATAKVTADRVERMVWKIDDVPEDQAADLIANLPESLQSLANRPLEDLADAAGMPAAAASLSAGVVGTVVMSAVVEPAEKAVHALEMVGLVIALVTGMHPLAVICIKHLAHDKLGSMLAKAFSRVISDTITAANRPPSAAPSPQAAGEPAGPATASRRPAIFHADPVTTDSWEPEPPRRIVIDCVTGMAREEHVVAEVADAARVPASPETEGLFREAVEGVSGNLRGTKIHGITSRQYPIYLPTWLPSDWLAM